MEWKNKGENIILDMGKFYISFNQCPSIGNEGPETALCFEKDGERQYLILIGDYRNEYETAIEKDGFGGALAVFAAHPDDVGSWSTCLTPA